MAFSKTWSGGSLEAAVGLIQSQHASHASDTLTAEMERELQVSLMYVGIGLVSLWLIGGLGF